MHSSKTLRGLTEITEYLKCSRAQFYEYIKLGMPARIILSKWHAHTDNLDEFFRSLTRCQVKGNIPEDAE